MTNDKNSTQQRDWNKQPVDFFNASPTQRRLYTQAYNELQKELPNVVLPIDAIRQRMQEIENRNSPVPPSIWIDSGDLPNAFARGYANYFLSPYNSGMPEEGPSDGQSVQYIKVDAIRFQLDALNDLCEVGTELPPSVHAKLANMRDDLEAVMGITPSDPAEDDYPEPPDPDDSVRFCPECETPNQFGEVCDRCRREIQTEGRDDLEID